MPSWEYSKTREKIIFPPHEYQDRIRRSNFPDNDEASIALFSFHLENGRLENGRLEAQEFGKADLGAFFERPINAGDFNMMQASLPQLSSPS